MRRQLCELQQCVWLCIELRRVNNAIPFRFISSTSAVASAASQRVTRYYCHKADIQAKLTHSPVNFLRRPDDAVLIWFIMQFSDYISVTAACCYCCIHECKAGRDSGNGQGSVLSYFCAWVIKNNGQLFTAR